MISTRLHVGTAGSSLLHRLRAMFHIRSSARSRDDNIRAPRVYADPVDTGRSAESMMAQMANRYSSSSACGGRHRW